MNGFFKNLDLSLLIAIFLLSLFGLTIIWSVVPSLFSVHFFYLAIGFLGLIIFSYLDYRILKSFSSIFYLFGVASLILTRIIGQVTRGSSRWIEIGIFRLQPSEIFKPFFILFFAVLLTNERKKKSKNLIWSFLLFILPVSLIFIQPDLGNVLIYGAVFLGIMITAISNFWPIFLGIFLVIFSSPLLWHFLKPYQQERLLTFVYPSKDPLGRGYNILQSIIAVGSGGLFGRGLGRGTQSHLLFLPEFHTDFIFSSLSEEFGFLGGVVLILLYIFLLLKILDIARRVKEDFAKFFCLGVFSMLFSQIFINIGMNLGLLPITGITLPLISYGGSSIFSTLISLGIVVNISRNLKKDQTLEIR